MSSQEEICGRRASPLYRHGYSNHLKKLSGKLTRLYSAPGRSPQRCGWPQVVEAEQVERFTQRLK